MYIQVKLIDYVKNAEIVNILLLNNMKFNYEYQFITMFIIIDNYRLIFIS